MSRRRGEFEHRTSIFEGAFRAWSHLGGLEPLELESKSAADLDPLTNPLENDARLKTGDKKKKKDKGGDNKDGKTSPVDENEELNNENDNDSGDNKDSEDKDKKGNANEDDAVTNDSSNISSGESSKRRIYPYEPLPRSGLSHPFVQAILSPWLGPDADQDAIQLGLTTLRTWWQHRRKGESGTAIGALGTEKMRGVVEGYTRHFFNLAHCLVTNDGEQPPRTLMTKMRHLEKFRSKKNKKKKGNPGNPIDGDEQTISGDQMSPFGMNNNNSIGGANGASVVYSDGNLEDQGQDAVDMDGSISNANLTPLERLHAAQRRQLAESGGVSFSNEANIDMTGKCIPGKINIPDVVDKVQAAHLAHRGNTSINKTANQYGDPNRTPVVFVSHNGDIQIAMSIDGITCAHCVKIVETVLRGCNGNKSPIAGLLDAAADRALNAVLIKIDQSSNAKRIAFESARNLSMVGYTAKAKEIDIVNMQQQNGRKVDLSILSTAWDVVANTEPTDVFNWNIPCTCPDNGVLRQDCARHSQMNKRIFEAFEHRESRITEFMAGCAKKFGMPCNCGANCKCKGCGNKCADKNQQMEQSSQQTQQQPEQHMSQDPYNHTQQVHSSHQAALHQQMMALHQQQQQQLGMGLGANGVNTSTSAAAAQQIMMQSAGYPNPMASVGMPPSVPAYAHAAPGMAVQRHSFSSWGGTGRMGRNMSITSENTFGRAMSGLSALSIDWENMEDFDVNVDHSAHINNGDYSNAAIAARIPKDDDGIMQVS